MWSDLSSTQQAALENDSDVLDFLRGDRSNESTGSGDFRERGSVLADIINSRPTFVPGGSGVPDVVYVGANGGMLHGFNAATGAEEFGYVPDAVYGKLADLKDQDYSHEYYVDGSVTFASNYYRETGNRIIVGGLGRGGQAIYALDVTNPDAFDPGDDVLWEFGDTSDADGDGTVDGDPDLGLTYAEASVVPLENGNWVAIFGNGYNNTRSDGSVSATGHAVLFIVDLETGESIRKIDTNTGGAGDPNGLATPAVVDLDQDGDADFAYAGDLDGNMWKFDLTGTNPNNFSAEKFPTAAGPGGGVQPITTRPEVGLHPVGLPGPVVCFGTGKYLTDADNSRTGQATQTFYAVWDQGAEGNGKEFVQSDLLEQEILKEETVSRTDPADPNETIENRLRTTTDNQITCQDSGSGSGKGGWYIDFTRPTSTDNRGEPLVTNPRLRGDRVVFTTLIPSESPCDFGGESWRMELSIAGGRRLEEPAFDLNEDQVFDSSDMRAAGDSPSGIQPISESRGILSEPTFLDSGDVEVKVMATTSGNTASVKNNPGSGDRGRQSREELR